MFKINDKVKISEAYKPIYRNIHTRYDVNSFFTITGIDVARFNRNINYVIEQIFEDNSRIQLVIMHNPDSLLNPLELLRGDEVIKMPVKPIKPENRQIKQNNPPDFSSQYYDEWNSYLSPQDDISREDIRYCMRKFENITKEFNKPKSKPKLKGHFFTSIFKD